MLSELHISNFALIDRQTISFGPGLNVISGESGTGKSLLLQALQFLLGAKPKAQIVRAGRDEARVEGLFDLSQATESLLHELPDMARSSELVLSRSILSSGKAKVFINGQLASMGLLEELARKLISICGQNQYVRLLDPRYHLELLDAFAGTGGLLARFRESFNLWRAEKAALEEQKDALARLSERREALEVTVQELEALGLKEGMRAELEEKVNRLSRAEKLITTAQDILELLKNGHGFQHILQRIAFQAAELLKLDPSLSAAQKLFSSARTELMEFESELERYVSKLDLDSKALDRFRDELAEVARLERKYRTDERGLLSRLAQAKLELDSLKGGSAALQELEVKVADLLTELNNLAAELSKKRYEAGERLAKLIVEGLSDLNMGKCRFSASISECELSLEGRDRVEFLIGTLKGEPLKPLRAVASGGELSRVMLVLKQVLREHDGVGVNVLVFDEVDSGISGGVARAVGEKLLKLSKYSQVICITHLPQIASLADHHFLVHRATGRTAEQSIIRKIEQDERVEEIARMLAGYKITQASRESARELMASKH